MRHSTPFEGIGVACRAGVGLVEVLVALAIGIVVTGTVLAIVGASERRARASEAGFVLVHRTVLLAAHLEADLGRAQRLSLAGEDLVLERADGLDPLAGGRPAMETIRYSIDAAGRVRRTVEVRPLPSGGTARRHESWIVRGPWAAVSLALEGHPARAVRVTVRPPGDRGRGATVPTTFLVHAPLVSPASYWPSGGAD